MAFTLGTKTLTQKHDLQKRQQLRFIPCQILAGDNPSRKYLRSSFREEKVSWEGDNTAFKFLRRTPSKMILLLS